MTLAEAIERLPTDKIAFNKVRYRWVDVVRGHPLLTPAQRQVGSAIAQKHINLNPENPWFHSAWAGHQKIADEIGLTRRTVVTAMAGLNQIGLIAIEHGGGRKVPGGRTDRYTLRTDWLDLLEGAVQLRRKDVKNFHGSNQEHIRQFDQSGEKNAESGEIDDQMMGNSPSDDVKELRTTLSKTIPLESVLSTFVGPRPPSETLLAATKQASNGRKEDSERITAQDHRDLADLLGEGNIQNGYCRLCDLDEADANALALRYRLDRSSGEAVRAEAARLEAALGRSE
jgi:hypothetical protein